MTTNDAFDRWQAREKDAEEMIPVIGRLHRDKGVTVVVHSKTLVNKSTVSILKAHRAARQVEGEELSVADTLPVLRAVVAADPGPARIDLGMLLVGFRESGATDLSAYVAEQLAPVLGGNKIDPSGPRDVVLYGFGRIGRLVARLLIEKAEANSGLRLRAVVVRKSGDLDVTKRASLLRRDSIHGAFQGSIVVDEGNDTIIANGNEIKFIYANSPDELDYTQYGISNAILIDNTGRWRDRAGLSQHLRPGIDKVVLTAPGKGDVPNIVHGVNQGSVDPAERILSCASCTTNAIVPPIKAMDDRFGIHSGHIETVHSFTNDQNLADNFHKADRRGRAATLNMVLTETGASSAIKKALPDLEANISGNSIRVPTPDVSIAVLNLRLKRETSKEEVLEYLREVSLRGPLKRAIDFTTAKDAVSSDFIGSRSAVIVDANAAIVNGDNAILYLWYDNEFGYSTQVVRVVQSVSGAEVPALPAV